MTTDDENSGPLLLTINGGSSSIKFAIFTAADTPQRRFGGQLERIGTAGARLSATGDESAKSQPVKAVTFKDGIQCIVDYLEKRLVGSTHGKSTIRAIGHRIVHGGTHLLEHKLITPELIAELHRTEPLDLAHLPREISLIEGFRDAFPGIPQVGCFDTAFHRDMPRVAQLLPIPRRYLDAGLRRFGFHGLSYTYLMSELARIAGPDAAPNPSLGRVILAHLGSGASMAAVRGGKPIDTTMGFTPTSGLVMSTRPGDMDAGLCVYLMHKENLSTSDMDRFISQECGLLGVSATSTDMRDLVAARATDIRAAEAVDLFCYSARQHIGALTGSLGGLDTLVFAGGIGERAPEIRAGICAGMDFLGLRIDETRNKANAAIISADDSRVTIRVIPTDEEVVIARIVLSITGGA